MDFWLERPRETWGGAWGWETRCLALGSSQRPSLLRGRSSGVGAAVPTSRHPFSSSDSSAGSGSPATAGDHRGWGSEAGGALLTSTCPGLPPPGDRLPGARLHVPNWKVSPYLADPQFWEDRTVGPLVPGHARGSVCPRSAPLSTQLPPPRLLRGIQSPAHMRQTALQRLLNQPPCGGQPPARQTDGEQIDDVCIGR